MKNKTNHTVEIVPQANSKIDTHNTQIQNRLHPWIGTDTSIKCGGVRLVVWAQTSPFPFHMRVKLFFWMPLSKGGQE